MTFAGALAAGLLTAVAIFQLALALGAPFGRTAWGGRNEGVLPKKLRIASAITAVVIYPAIIAYVLAAAELVDLPWLPTEPIGMWILAGLFTLGALGNLASRSKVERIWGPVSLAIASCCATIALQM
jgi:hypothetical protein